jgi:hypothetical protein
MNRSRCLRAIVLTAGLLGLPALAMAAPDMQHIIPSGQAPDPTPVAPVAPCHVQVHREISPRVLRAGEAVTLSVEGTWECDGRSLPPTDLMLVIEDTEALRGAQAGGLPQPLSALKGALPALIDAAERIDAHVGVMRIGRGWLHDLPVEGGAAHFAKIRSLVADLARPLGGAPHRYLGITAGSGLMPPGGRQFLLLVDAGQPFRPVTTEQVDYCRLVRSRHGLAVLSLHAAERRYADCPTPGLFFESISPAGEDLPERIDAIIDAILREQPPTALRYEHPLEIGTWNYEPEGVAPRPPDEDGPRRLAWEQPLRDGREGEFVFRYRLRSAADLAPGELRLSADPGAWLLFDYPEDRITRRLRAEWVCVYRAGRRDEDCAEFVPGQPPTPTLPTRTSTLTTTPTPTARPSSTPTSTLTPTSTPPPYLFLPRVLGARLGGR